MSAAVPVSDDLDWSDSSESELVSWRGQLQEKAKLHEEAARSSRTRHVLLTASHTILAAAASTIAMAGGPCPSGAVLAGLSALVAGLAGVQATMRLDVKSERHDRACDALESVAKYVGWQLAIPRSHRERVKTVFVYVTSRIDAIEETAPLL